jgi:hypothetical protein
MTREFYPSAGVSMPPTSPMGTPATGESSDITREPLSSWSVSAVMKKILTATVLAVALVVPTGAVAKPDKSEKEAAKAQCKAERGKSSATREAFKAKYRGFSDCVRRNAAEEEAENGAAQKNAAKECKAERDADPVGFRDDYGTNKNGKNAFGKCVSTKAKEKKAQMDAEDAREVAEFKNAAKQCSAEREEMGSVAFAEEYGTNKNGKNAFGKCVSRKARGGS